MTTKSLQGFSIGDEVEVLVDGPVQGQIGRIVLFNDSQVTNIGVVFPWDVTSMPMYFEATELERK